MGRDQVLAALREHEAERRAAGVVRRWLFGSTARGDRHAGSDIDLLARFDGSRRISLLGIAGIQLRLSSLLGQTVVLMEEGTLKPRVQSNVAAEALLAF